MSKKLKENQILAAQLLATGKTGRAVAEELGIAEETISRWKQDKDFQKYLTELLMDSHETAKIRLQNLLAKAITSIEKNIDDPSVPPKEKFAVGLKVIELCNTHYNCLNQKLDKLNSPFDLL